jgi:predicted Zn-dependent protease
MKKYFIIFSVLFLFVPALAYSATEIRDTEIESVIEKIVHPLKPNTKIHILADNDFNAFVRGGEDIYINTGLIQKSEHTAEIQAVLAHEIGHSELGHMVQMSEKMRDESNRAIIMQALGIGLIAVNPNAAMGMMIGANGMAVQSMLAFTRDEERSADDYAIRLLEKKNINPYALLSVFKKMQDTQGDGNINPNNVSHPLTEERIKNIKLHVKNNKLPNENILPMIHAKLIGYLGSTDQINTLYPNKDKSDAAIYARSIANMRSGNFESAKTAALNLISRQKKNPYFFELLGDIEFQYGHYDDSISAYEESLKLKSGSAQIEIALALVLSERNKSNDFERATELCKRTILKEPMPLAYWVLAKSDKKNTDYYLSEYYMLMNDTNLAKKYATLALKNLSHKSPEYLKSQDILENIKSLKQKQ